MVSQTKDIFSELGTELEIAPERTMKFTLRLRIPGWARNPEVKVNGEPFSDKSQGGYLAITRSWKPGDRVSAQFGAVLRIVPDGINDFSPKMTGFHLTSQTAMVERGAIVYGPWVLMVDPALNPHEMYYWENLEIIAPHDGSGGIKLPRPDEPVAGRSRFTVPGACFMALGRGVKMPERVEKNIFDPTHAPGIARPVTKQAPELTSAEWKVVFLVPVSELTGRRTPTTHRMIPYEVRNDIHVLGASQADVFDQRVSGDFISLRENKWLKTTGYRINMLQRGARDQPGGLSVRPEGSFT
jgi:hypothetical protein